LIIAEMCCAYPSYTPSVALDSIASSRSQLYDENSGYVLLK